MRKIIKRFANNYYLEYDSGSFDDWCVYINQSKGIRCPPKVKI